MLVAVAATNNPPNLQIQQINLHIQLYHGAQRRIPEQQTVQPALPYTSFTTLPKPLQNMSMVLQGTTNRTQTAAAGHLVEAHSSVAQAGALDKEKLADWTRPHTIHQQLPDGFNNTHAQLLSPCC
jgi:hypothetical protein